MASTSEATNSSNTPNNNNNNTPGAGTDTPPRPPIERPSALFEDVNPYNREASPEAWLRWEMFKHWKGFEQKPMEAVQGWLFVWIPIILVLLLILGPIGWITFVLLIFFYPVLISLVEALILLWCDAHFVMDIIFNPLILWEFFIMTLKILYCKNLVFDPVSSAEGHLEALIHFRIKYVQLKLFFDTYEPRKDIWLRNHFYNLNNQYPKHVMDGLSRAHAKDQSWLWFYSKYAARVIAGIALLSLAAGLTFFFRKSKTMTKWLVGKKKEATIRKTSFFTSFVNVLIAFAGIFTLITGLTDIIDTMKTVLTIFSFGRWMNGQRKRKCTVDRKCCIFHDYTGLIGTLFGCYCDCHEAGDIGLKPDTPLYTPEDGKPATPPLFRKNKGKEPMSDSDDDDEDGFQMFEDEMERIIKKAREARPPRSRFFDYYDGYSAKFYDVFNYIVENPSITSTKVMDRSIPMPLNPERWNNYWRAFIIADMIAQENQYPAKAFERAMDRAAEIARNANKHAQAARKTEVFITYLIIGGTAFLCGLTIYLTYLAIRWATGLSKLEKKYRKLKPKKCDKAENCTDVSKKHRKKFNHPIPHDETTQPPTPPKEVRECRFGDKCKKRSDKDHCAQFNHPKEEAREWGNEPYGRKSKNRTSKGKTKGRANDSTTPKKARFDPADYERSDFALDNKEMKYWQDLKRSLRERPNREDVEDTQRKARDRLEKLEKSFDYAVAGPTAKRMYKRDVALLKTMCNAKFRGNRVTFTDPDDPEFQKVTSKRVIYADSKRKWANDDKRNWGDSDDDEMDFQKDYDDWMKEANKRRPLPEAVKGEMDKAWNKYWASLTKDESMIKILEDCRQAFIESLPKDHPYRLRPPEAPKPQRVEANVSALRAVTKCWLCDAGHNYWSCPKNRDHHWRMAMGATTLLTEDVKPIKEFGILYNSTKNFFDLEKMRVVKRESHSPENPPVNIDKAVLSLEPVFADIEGEDFVGTGWGTGNYFASAFHVHTDTPHIKGEALKKAKIDKETEDYLKSLDIILYERPKRVEPAKIDIAEDNSSVHVFGFIDNQLSYGRGYMKRYDHNDAQHSAPTDDGMSGGPIWNSQMTKIIGIHQGTNGRPNDNYGRWFDAKLAGVLRTGRLNA